MKPDADEGGTDGGGRGDAVVPIEHKAGEEAGAPTKEQKALVRGLSELMQAAGIGTHYKENERAEMQRILDAYGDEVRVQKGMVSLNEAEDFIAESLKGKHRGQRMEVELPKATQAKARRAMGKDFDSHNIYANGIVHSKETTGRTERSLRMLAFLCAMMISSWHLISWWHPTR